MKHIGKRFFCAILTIVMITSVLCSSVSASVRSSAYLNAYGAAVTPIGNGVVVVTATVVGVGRMTELGVKTVYLYESRDGIDFWRAASYESEDYPIMMGSGTNFFEDVVTYRGTAGYYYYASVYVYAANANGSDLKNYRTSIKQAT